MKKRRFLFLIVNLIAILAALGSAFLPWWQGARPSDIALVEILPLGFLENLSFNPNVVVAIFAGAAITAIGALLAFKLIVLAGIIVNLATIALWFTAFNIGWEPSKFGHGLYLLGISILIATFSLLIPKRRRDKNRR